MHGLTNEQIFEIIQHYSYDASLLYGSCLVYPENGKYKLEMAPNEVPYIVVGDAYNNKIKTAIESIEEFGDIDSGYYTIHALLKWQPNTVYGYYSVDCIKFYKVCDIKGYESSISNNIDYDNLPF